MLGLKHHISATKNNDIKVHKARSVYLILSAGFIAVAVIPLLVLSNALWSSAWDNAWREVEEKHKLLAINLLSPLSIYVQSNQNSLNLISHQIGNIKKGSNSVNLEGLMDNTTSYLKNFQSLFFTDTNGNIIYRAKNKMHEEIINTYLFKETRCFQQAALKHRRNLSGIMPSTLKNKLTILLCEPVTNQNNEISGILIAELDIAPIEEIRRQIKFGTLGHSAFIDQFGKVIAHPNPAWMKEMKDISSWPIAKKMAKGERGVTEFYSPFMGENMVAGYAGDTATGWGVMVPQPRSEIEKQVYDLIKNHIIWGALGLSTALVFAILLARWITIPINQLTQSAIALKNANFEGAIPDANRHAPREIHQLTLTIQSLSAGFNESKNEIQQLNQSLEEKINRATQDLKLANVHLEQIASVDDLTDLANRRHIHRELRHVHEQSISKNTTYSILLCDLDHFKQVNDRFGHHIGDCVLKIFSKIAPKELREGDMIGRWGGEEFLCVLKDTTPEEAAKTAERIRKTINRTLPFDNNINVEMSVSIGVASYPSCGESIDLMLSNADTALYEAKKNGRNQVISSAGNIQGISTIAGLIKDALNEKNVHAAFQQIVNLQSNKVVAEETLARIIVDNEEVEAYRFIEAASQLQLIHKIDYELIDQTITRMHANNGSILQFINVSTDLLHHSELTSKLIDRLEKWKIQHIQTDAPIVIEITEREFFGDTEQALKLLKPFLDKGYSLAIDDFGSGYSSFQYLTDLPIDYLKIEGRLISRAIKEPKVRAVLMAIQDTARDLNIVTLAECIEDKETAELLKKIGINLGQGHYFGKPETDIDK